MKDFSSRQSENWYCTVTFDLTFSMKTSNSFVFKSHLTIVRTCSFPKKKIGVSSSPVFKFNKITADHFFVSKLNRDQKELPLACCGAAGLLLMSTLAYIRGSIAYRTFGV